MEAEYVNALLIALQTQRNSALDLLAQSQATEVALRAELKIAKEKLNDLDDKIEETD